MIINCPNCESPFRVEISSVDHTGQKYTNDSPITPAAMRAVLEFMDFMGPGRYANSILTDAYAAQRRHRETWPELTSQALVMALKRNGAVKWRTPSQRGWEIPEVDLGQRAAPVARSVREAIDRRDYRETVFARRDPGPDVGIDPLTGKVPVMREGPDGKLFRDYSAERAPLPLTGEEAPF